MIKTIIKSLIDKILGMLSSTTTGRYIHRRLVEDAMGKTQEINHNDVSLKLTVPNLLNVYRAESFASKEPETLEWIDSFSDGKVLWDIGANVGLYSCYAASKKKCQVIAFEPSVFNLELLARNIHNNNLTDQISIFPLPLNDRNGQNKLNMTTTEWGGALSTFGQHYGQDGKPLERVFTFQTYGVEIDSLMDWLNFPVPDYLKMDVDGIEHLIMKGGKGVLSKVDSVLVEINDDFAEQAENCAALLTAAGLRLDSKKHAEGMELTSMKNSYNQIWSR